MNGAMTEGATAGAIVGSIEGGIVYSVACALGGFSCRSWTLASAM